MALYLKHFALVGPVGNFILIQSNFAYQKMATKIVVFTAENQSNTQKSLVGLPTDIGEEPIRHVFVAHPLGHPAPRDV